MDAKIIRKAICKNRGGLENADDGQLLLIWNSLDKETQAVYIQSIEERKAKDAVSH